MKAPQRYDGKTMKRPFFVAVLLIVLLFTMEQLALLGLVFSGGIMRAFIKRMKYRKNDGVIDSALFGYTY